MSAIFVHAQLLEEKLGRGDEHPLVAANTSVATLLGQLQRLKVLINSAHRIADEMPVMEVANLAELVHDVARETHALFPHVQIRCLTQPGPLPVRMFDGEVGLRRIVENVLRNACEGNGTDSARNVTLELSVERTEVCMVVSDDGPGFGLAQLNEPPAALQTTKAYGHGLGLYNVHELVLASGGALTRGNAAHGGAVVKVTLQKADSELLSPERPDSDHAALKPAAFSGEVANE